MQFSTADLLDAAESPVEPDQLPTPASQAKPFEPFSKAFATVFDIETGPLPPETLWKIVPPFDPASIAPFDPASVATGNLKDPAKIAEKIAMAEAKHAAAAASAKPDYERAVTEKAALDPLTGRVLAIGYIFSKDDDLSVEFSDGTPDGERDLLLNFWDFAATATDSNRMVGHNIHGFDLPFLYRRSLLLGVRVPAGVLEQGRYWSAAFVDTMRVWACGGAGMVGLDRLARAFGVGEKIGDGAVFAELWAKGGNREEAREYLANDLGITYEVARRLGVCR